MSRFCSAGAGFLPYLLTFKMASIDIPRQDYIRQKDEQLLATLGYKQEFKRAFTPLEVIDFWSRCSKIWLICGGLWYRLLHHWITALHSFSPFLCHPKWRRPSDGVGGELHHVYLWISLTLSSVVSRECIRIVRWHCHGRACVSCSNFWRCTYDFKFCCRLNPNPKLTALFLDLFIGFSAMEKCFMLARRVYAVRASPCKRTDFYLLDANTIGSIACVASVDWGCAVQIMATVTIGSGGSYGPTSAQLL